jgi:hypothetical protein
MPGYAHAQSTTYSWVCQSVFVTLVTTQSSFFNPGELRQPTPLEVTASVNGTAISEVDRATLQGRLRTLGVEPRIKPLCDQDQPGLFAESAAGSTGWTFRSPDQTPAPSPPTPTPLDRDRPIEVNVTGGRPGYAHAQSITYSWVCRSVFASVTTFQSSSVNPGEVRRPTPLEATASLNGVAVSEQQRARLQQRLQTLGPELKVKPLCSDDQPGIFAETEVTGIGWWFQALVQR